MNMFIVLILLYFINLYKFSVKSNHLLLMLMIFEFISLIIFFMIILIVWNYMEKFILMYYLTFCVCEGAFGLSLLVMLIRSVGSDFFQNLNFLKC